MPFFGGGTGDYHIVGTNIKGGTQAAPAVIGDNNMALGNGAGQLLSNADQNVLIGNAAGAGLTNAVQNIVMGYEAGASMSPVAYSNVIIGAEAAGGAGSVSDFNQLIGSYCGYGATLYGFTGLGASVATGRTINNAVGIGNSALTGGGAGSSDNSVAVGIYAGAGQTSGIFTRDFMVAVGTSAGFENTASNVNMTGAVAVGNLALNYSGVGDFSALNTVAIGNGAGKRVGALVADNSIYIGHNIAPTASNQIIIGGVSHTSILIGGIDFSAIATGTFPELIVGDPGTEGGGINVNGVTYDSTLKISDIDGTNFAQTILHRHSTILEPLIVGARSNSNTNAHASVVNGMGLFSVYATGWAGTNYKIFGTETFGADDTGTISNTSAPGKWTLSLTPDGGVAPVEAMRINSSRAVGFGGANFGTVGQVLKSSGAGAVPVWADAAKVEYVAKVFVGFGGPDGGVGTVIPTSVNPAGDYTTKLDFQSEIRDDLGTVVDLANSRFVIPSGYSECRITYNLAWASNASGWRGMRVKNGAGNNYGNVRMISVGVGATSNNNYVSPWIPILSTGATAPDTINAGDYFEFWPAQTSGGDLLSGADLASSFVQIEIR